MAAIPKSVSFQREVLHYKASYMRKANTLNVQRELLVQSAQRFSWKAATDSRWSAVWLDSAS